MWIAAAAATACAVLTSKAVALSAAPTTSVRGIAFEDARQRPLRTGFLDPPAFAGPHGVRSVLRARRAGASLVRVLLSWSAVAPEAPLDPVDPEDPAYRWQSLDRQIVDAVRGGLEPVVYISAAPPWARGEAVGLPGTWPSPLRFGQFARAAARRYSGTFTRTGSSAPLPRVRLWQAWNEPNAGRELTPQRVQGRPISPAHYRRMLNAFAVAVHGVDVDDLVVAGLGPFGHDSKDIQVVAPMSFMSTLLCVSLQEPHRRTCSKRTRFDVWAHNAYSNGGPNWHASSPADASIGDLPEMRALLAAAKRAGTIVSSRPPEFWVSEISWDTRPPDPRGVPSGLHARWVAEALYRAWEAGVSAVIWFRLQDDPLGQSPYQSGFFTVNGRVKHSLRAFRFPFVAFRARNGVSVWGRTPYGKRGSLIVERNGGGRHWIPVARLRATRNGIFSGLVAAPTATTMRARLLPTAEASVPFSLSIPLERRATPFGCGGPIPC